MKLNIPYFKQEKNTTCGVACVRMIFSFYGTEEACETGWLGYTCSELVRCRDGFGLKSEEVGRIDLNIFKANLKRTARWLRVLTPQCYT
ncbi:hypothetical protein HKBW3S43_01828, partial [Candidatus Hakubella thermalkaliphila]